MAYTYSGDPAASDLDNVRNKLGDVDPDDTDTWLLSDEEIEAEIATYDNLFLAAAECAENIAARFARKVTFSIGRKSKQMSDLSEHFYKLAEKLRERSMMGTDISPEPFSGTSTQDAIFKRDLMTYPGCEADDGDGVAE